MHAQTRQPSHSKSALRFQSSYQTSTSHSRTTMQLSLLLVSCVTLQVIPQLTTAIEVGPAQEKILVDIRDKYQCCYENERASPVLKQYAVVYWATDTESAIQEIDFDSCKKHTPWQKGIFFEKPDYTFQPDDSLNVECGFVAGLLKRRDRHHTEKTCFWSFRKDGNANKNEYERCPNRPKKEHGDVYMYTHFSPCTPEDPNDPDLEQRACTSIIRAFAKECAEHFNNLYIGYIEDFNGTADKAQKVIHAIPNAAMKRITVKPMDCQHSNDCKNTKTKNEL